MIKIFIFILGTIFGSFLNVCITRLPQKKSIVSPRSACPNCLHPIKLYYNIPVLGYLILRGKCDNCNWPIPKRYLIVEILTAVIVILLYQQFKFTPQFFLYSILCFNLIIITFIDIEHKLILDKITLPFIVIGACLAIITHTHTFVNILAGIVGGSGLLILIAVLGKLIYKKESMGGGDIKLAAMVGSFLGFEGVIISLLIAIISGAVIGLIIAKIYKTDCISFGPFVSLGAMLFIFNPHNAITLFTSALLGSTTY